MKQSQDSVFYQVNLTEREVEAIGANREERNKFKAGFLLPALLILLGCILCLFLWERINNDWVEMGIIFILIGPGFMLYFKKQLDFEKAGKAFLKTIQGR